jgi:hypothetical protein
MSVHIAYRYGTVGSAWNQDEAKYHAVDPETIRKDQAGQNVGTSLCGRTVHVGQSVWGPKRHHNCQRCERKIERIVDATRTPAGPGWWNRAQQWERDECMENVRASLQAQGPVIAQVLAEIEVEA